MICNNGVRPKILIVDYEIEVLHEIRSILKSGFTMEIYAETDGIAAYHTLHFRKPEFMI